MNVTPACYHLDLSLVVCILRSSAVILWYGNHQCRWAMFIVLFLLLAAF